MTWFLKFLIQLHSYFIGVARRAQADLSYLLAVGNTQSCVVRTIDGEQPIGPQACVFVHFDKRGVIRSHTRLYIDALADQGPSIILVTNSGKLAPESLAYARRACSRVIIRRNRGYDFGGFRDGILSLGIEPGKFTSVVLANDSVYGPITALSGFFNKLNFGFADVWGATDSWQHSYHLQTYLIAFGHAAITHSAFGTFWRNVRNVRSKWAAVHYYETALTQHLQVAGLRCEAVWDYQAIIQAAHHLSEDDDVDRRAQPLAPMIKAAADRAVSAAAARRALNPTNELWLLLLWHGFPFVKRELLLLNRTGVPDIALWHRVVSARSPGLYREIIKDLRRLTHSMAP